jgi:hypothetical protein
VLFLVALVVYFPGIWWGVTPSIGVPFGRPWGTDELAPMQAITELYGIFLAHHPIFNPQYPPVQYLVQAVFMAPYLIFLVISGGISHPQTLYPYGYTDPVTAVRITTYLARAASWIMAAGTVLIAYRIGVVIRDRLMGLISSVMALLLYPMLYYARVSNVDMGALFWTAIGLNVFAVCLRDGINQRRMIWLGVLAAVATATKDASWPAFFMMAAVLVCRDWRSNGFGAHTRILLGSLGVAVLTYLVASGLVFRPSRYIVHVKWITEGGLTPGYREPTTFAGYFSLTGKITNGLIEAMGLPTVLCVLAGIVICLFHKRLTLSWALPGIGVVLFVIVPARFVQLRFMIVVAYVLVFFAAYALREAWEYTVLKRVAPLLFILLTGWEALRAADLTWQMVEDSRYDAATWLKQHARTGDRMLHFTLPTNLPHLEPGVTNVMAPRDASYRFKRTSEDPEFVFLMPVSFNGPNPPHETNLAESEYLALCSGEAGYQQVASMQAPSLFAQHPFTWVNPVVRLFARKDIVAQR